MKLLINSTNCYLGIVREPVDSLFKQHYLICSSAPLVFRIEPRVDVCVDVYCLACNKAICTAAPRELIIFRLT